jgi:hypothetical protein
VDGYTNLLDGVVLDLATLPTRNLTIVANVADDVRSIRFSYDPDANTPTRVHSRLEVDAPFALAGDTNGDLRGFTPTAGAHHVRAVPYVGERASGAPGTPRTLDFVVIDDSQR